MSIRFKILGDPGRDNALLVSVDSGQSLTKLLFDCGEGCLSSLSVSEIKSIDHILFSHLHMDHICGFDTFFRVTFNRESKENHIWGPTETVRIMQHRFRGFMWNLADEISGKWMVHDIDEKKVETKDLKHPKPSPNVMMKGQKNTMEQSLHIPIIQLRLFFSITGPHR